MRLYTSRASNAAGEAFTTTTVYCEGKEGLSEETQHPEGEADWNRFNVSRISCCSAVADPMPMKAETLRFSLPSSRMSPHPTSPICSRVILPTLKPRSVRDQTMTVASFLMASFSSSAIANALFTHSVWSFWKLSAPNSKIPTFTLIGTVLHLFHFSNTKTVIIYLKISDGQG